jgi:opacity protein-like surface antigen
MKRMLFIALLAIGLFWQSPAAKAQPMEFGGGLVLSESIPAFGIQGKVTYDLEFLMKNLSGSGGLTLFFPASSGSYNYGRWSLDLDGHYTFYGVQTFTFYGIGGINITHYKKDPDDELTLGKDIGTTPGLNIGGGVRYTLPNGVVAFSEAKFAVNYYQHAALSFGLLWDL